MQIPQRIVPTILFGAFDRHNLGDLLFPHVAARLLDDDNLLFAGVAERDLSHAGGFRVHSISKLAKVFGNRPINILHVGGELLTCEAWPAAVMVQPPEQVQPIIQRLEARADERGVWTRDTLEIPALAPYVASRELFPEAINVIYNAVGGVELNERDQPFRTEVITKLSESDYLSIRDQQTRVHLSHYGIHSHLVPDPAVMVAELFGERIEQCVHAGEVAGIDATFPQGYIAFQFSADFGDDATLVQIAGQLDQVTALSGYGVALFRAGAAPWHDDLECYRRLERFMKSTQVKVFDSLNIWDICALIANSRVYCGSSLHGRIVAMAFGVPRVNLSHPHNENRSGKQAAYAATWELPGIHHTIAVAEISAGVQQAMVIDQEQLKIHSQALMAKYLEEFTTILALLSN